MQRQTFDAPRSGRDDPQASRISPAIRMRKPALDSELEMERQMAVRKMNAKLTPLIVVKMTAWQTRGWLIVLIVSERFVGDAEKTAHEI